MTDPVNVTPEARRAVADAAARHGLSEAAVTSMLYSLRIGGGTMAQFDIPELGGSGQWMRGGMTMVGNMFDNALKARVDALCNDLAQLLADTTVFPHTAAAGSMGFSATGWWPTELGVPSSTGGQNDVRYAIFPGTRRLAIQIGSATRVFDTGEHHIGGVQQQQGGGNFGSVTFTSQLGTFDVSSLAELGARHATQTQAQSAAGTQPAGPTASAHPAPVTAPPPTAPAASAPPIPTPVPAPVAANTGAGDPTTIIAAIEALAGLRERGILSDEEFATKKTELLGRL